MKRGFVQTTGWSSRTHLPGVPVTSCPAKTVPSGREQRHCASACAIEPGRDGAGLKSAQGRGQRGSSCAPCQAGGCSPAGTVEK